MYLYAVSGLAVSSEIALPGLHASAPGRSPDVTIRSGEVLVSQMQERGAQMVPELTPPDLYGLEAGDAPGEDYCARVLRSICSAAIVNGGDRLFVNYRALPAAVERRILPHFGLAPTPAECDAMNRAARQDAKAPQFSFAADGETKQRRVTPAIRAAVERHLAEVYGRLEALRGD